MQWNGRGMFQGKEGWEWNWGKRLQTARTIVSKTKKFWQLPDHSEQRGFEKTTSCAHWCIMCGSVSCRLIATMQGNSGRIEFSSPILAWQRWRRDGITEPDSDFRGPVSSVRWLNSSEKSILWSRTFGCINETEADKKGATECQNVFQNREISFNFPSRVGWQMLRHGKECKKKIDVNVFRLLKVCRKKGANCFDIRWSCQISDGMVQRNLRIHRLSLNARLKNCESGLDRSCWYYQPRNRDLLAQLMNRSNASNQRDEEKLQNGQGG